MKQAIASPASYVVIWFALLLLLLITFGVAHVDLGPFNAVAAMLISVTKAALVAMFFMHLRHGIQLNKVLAGLGIFWLMILLTLVLADYITRPWLPVPGK